MSKVIVSYKKKQNESFYLRSWIKHEIESLMAIHSRYPVWPIVKRFIPPCKTTVHTLFNRHNLQDARHFVKVTGFHNVNNFTVYGSVRDDYCHLLVEFTPTCVTNFERHHSIRITSQTVNTIFLIGDVALKYVPVSDISDSGKWSFNMGLDPRISAVPILVVGQCLAFDLDQVETRFKFSYLYQLNSFVNIFA
ncbi:LAFA_0D08900g1_1 [Lachancea sp. 'fantastica']|nr:LAFA_0D08900g1_1 [Lachancea sp. 'fantastica']